MQKFYQQHPVRLWIDLFWADAQIIFMPWHLPRSGHTNASMRQTRLPAWDKRYAP